jgi:hypothetical protein
MPTSPSPILSWAVADLPHKGERVSGDAAVVETWPGGALIAGIDALGHGPEAEQAAKAAVEILRNRTSDAPTVLMEQCHQALRRTRGVAMTLVAIDGRQDELSWVGIGNVEAMLIRADPQARPRRDSAVLRGGIVGGQIPTPRVTHAGLRRDDTIVLVTDGISSKFTGLSDVSAPPEELANRILKEYGKGTDDALVLVARYLGGGSP